MHAIKFASLTQKKIHRSARTGSCHTVAATNPRSLLLVYLVAARGGTSVHIMRKVTQTVIKSRLCSYDDPGRFDISFWNDAWHATTREIDKITFYDEIMSIYEDNHDAAAISCLARGELGQSSSRNILSHRWLHLFFYNDIESQIFFQKYDIDAELRKTFKKTAMFAHLTCAVWHVPAIFLFLCVKRARDIKLIKRQSENPNPYH